MLKVTKREFPQGILFNFEGANSVKLPKDSKEFIQVTGDPIGPRQLEAIVNKYPEFNFS